MPKRPVPKSDTDTESLRRERGERSEAPTPVADPARHSQTAFGRGVFAEAPAGRDGSEADREAAERREGDGDS